MTRCQSMSVRLCAFLLIALILLIDGSKSFVIQPKSWDFKGHYIAYEEARQDDKKRSECQEPILLLNGFGVGTFHQHRLVAQLLKHNDENMVHRAIYMIDYLGQGQSWPRDCDDGNSPNEKGLIYSADTWLDQITQFLEQVVRPENDNRKVHVVGNSVGGLLAAVLATRRPDLVETICLMNATPIWGLNLPGWSGHLPSPAIPRRVGRFLFDRIRDASTIEKYLDTCYANREAFDEQLMSQIRACTEGKGGHAAFASILWSPPATLQLSKNFYENLQAVECDALLLFGEDDPWCKPAFARRMIQNLRSRHFSHNPVCRYIGLDRVGHCPGHEALQAVGKLLRSWVAAEKRDENHLTLINGSQEVFQEAWATITMRETDDIPMKLMDRLTTRFM